MPLSIESDHNEARLVLRLKGNVDGETAGILERECSSWITRGIKTMVLDFDGVKWISSAGLYSVMQAGKQLRAGAGELLLSGMHGSVKDVFGLTGIDALFPVFATADDALNHLRQPGH